MKSDEIGILVEWAILRLSFGYRDIKHTRSGKQTITLVTRIRIIQFGLFVVRVCRIRRFRINVLFFCMFVVLREYFLEYREFCGEFSMNWHQDGIVAIVREEIHTKILLRLASWMPTTSRSPQWWACVLHRHSYCQEQQISLER